MRSTMANDYRRNSRPISIVQLSPFRLGNGANYDLATSVLRTGYLILSKILSVPLVTALGSGDLPIIMRIGPGYVCLTA